MKTHFALGWGVVVVGEMSRGIRATFSLNSGQLPLLPYFHKDSSELLQSFKMCIKGKYFVLLLFEGCCFFFFLSFLR